MKALFIREKESITEEKILEIKTNKLDVDKIKELYHDNGKENKIMKKKVKKIL